jgi:hypothetical protein
MKLGEAVDVAKAWAKSLVIPLAVGVLLGKADVARVPFSMIFPDRDWIGGVTFPLAPVPAPLGQPDLVELVLVRQSMKPTSKIDFLRRGSSAMSRVFAGVAADGAGSAIPLTGGLNGVRFLELEIPAKTLGGTSVVFKPGSVSKSSYVVTIGEVSKNLSDPDDLVIYTKNEARWITIVHCLIAFSVAMTAFFVARATPLQHPGGDLPEDTQWV